MSLMTPNLRTTEGGGTKETTEAMGTMEAEGRKSHFAISMARTKAIGRTSAPSPSRGKRSSTGKMPSQRSQ